MFSCSLHGADRLLSPSPPDGGRGLGERGIPKPRAGWRTLTRRALAGLATLSRKRARVLWPILPLILVAACAPSTQSMGPAMTMPQLGDSEFLAADGALLPISTTAPEGRPKAIILALHGFNDYSNAYAEPAGDWAKAGILTVALDQRGFGRSKRRGIWAGSDTLVADARNLAEAARRRWPDLPITLVGESMGAAIALLATQRPDPAPVDRVVLLAPAVWGRETIGPFGSATLWLLAHTVPWLEVTPQNLNVLPSDNIAMLRALGRDPLVIKRTRVDSIYGLVDLMDRAQAAAPRLALPTLVLWGGKEELIPDKAQTRFNADLPQDLVRIETLAGGYHMLLRDLNPGPARTLVAEWGLEGP